MDKVCDHCGELPESFLTDSNEVAYFFFSWKGDTEMCHLLSSGEVAFGCCTEKNPTDERFNFYCINCAERFMEGDNE
jgi:hypothetical protein